MTVIYPGLASCQNCRGCQSLQDFNTSFAMYLMKISSTICLFKNPVANSTLCYQLPHKRQLMTRVVSYTSRLWALSRSRLCHQLDNYQIVLGNILVYFFFQIPRYDWKEFSCRQQLVENYKKYPMWKWTLFGIWGKKCWQKPSERAIEQLNDDWIAFSFCLK